MYLKFSVCLIFIALLAGCAAQTNITPIGQGELNGHASFGGPIIEAFGTRIPIPYFTAGATCGLSNQINLGGNLHLLPLAYELFGMDAATGERHTTPGCGRAAATRRPRITRPPGVVARLTQRQQPTALTPRFRSACPRIKTRLQATSHSSDAAPLCLIRRDAERKVGAHAQPPAKNP